MRLLLTRPSACPGEVDTGSPNKDMRHLRVSRGTMAAPKRKATKPAKPAGARILVVEARFYDAISDALLAGASKALEEAHASWDSVASTCAYSAEPTYYDYGSSVVYEGDAVYVNGDPVGLPEQRPEQVHRRHVGISRRCRGLCGRGDRRLRPGGGVERIHPRSIPLARGS